jgi:transcriptional regulator with XRE-family HTH domain
MAKTKFDRQRVRQLIEDRDLRVYWLADRCDVSPEYMSQVLTGKRKPSLSLVRLMAYVLEVPEDAVTKGATRVKAS